eukprot:g5321.t1
MRPERHYCHGALSDAGTRREKAASVAECHERCAGSAHCAYFTYYTAHAPTALAGKCLLVPKRACGADRMTPYKGVLACACVDPVQDDTHQIVESKNQWLKELEAKSIEECERLSLKADSCRFGTARNGGRAGRPRRRWAIPGWRP